MEKYIREGGDFVREIKFRAWDEENKRWYKDSDCVLEFDGFITQINIVGEYDGDLFYSFDNKKGLILVQYIGLKDKNGKEIYESDIVKYRQRNLNNAFGGKGEPWEENIRVVEWFNNGWTIPQGFVKDIEVIGNKYSNPELLEN